MTQDGHQGHRWSGWPGAFCLDCGCEDAFENALGLNWVDVDPTEDEPRWKSLIHKELVELCNSRCPRDMTPEEIEEMKKRAAELEKMIAEKEKKTNA